MAILAVNAGSSSLKFSLHPLLGGRVRPSVLSGTIEGLEPGGQPEMAWTFAGQRQRKAVGGPGATPFLQALDCLRTFVTGEADMGCPPIAAEVEEYEELNMGSSRFMCVDTHLVGAFMDELSDGDVLRMISSAEDLAR